MLCVFNILFLNCVHIYLFLFLQKPLLTILESGRAYCCLNTSIVEQVVIENIGVHVYIDTYTHNYVCYTLYMHKYVCVNIHD